MIPPNFYDSPLESISIRLFPRKGGGGGGGHASGGGKGSGSAGSSGSSGARSGSVGISSGKGTRSASSSSRGGGSPMVIPSGSPFAGRLSGGATRDQIYGNSRIGSGYTYGGYGNFYGGRPFPYGFYPIFIVPGYYGGDEYGPNLNDTRPGGVLSTAVVQPSASSNNASSPDSYYIVGDQTSVSEVLVSLVSKCGIVNGTVTSTYMNGTLTTNGTALVPHPEQMVQYYRASSFALGLSTYNNSAALLSRAPASNDSATPPLSEDTSLPAGINTILLTCLNSTIAATLPLLDTEGDGLSETRIAQIVVGTFAGFAIVVILLTHFGCCRIRRRTSY